MGVCSSKTQTVWEYTDTQMHKQIIKSFLELMFTVAATWNCKFKTEHILISYTLMFLNESL